MAAGGTECGRSAPGTATPMTPRKGRSGNSTTGSPPSVTGSRPTSPPSRSATVVKTLTVPGVRGNSPGSAPRPWRLEITP